MGFMSGVAPCFVCKRIFSFNVELVPSYEDQPICADCIAQANEIRKREGRPLWPVDPRAYEAQEVP